VNSVRCLSLCAFVLSLVPSLASGDEPSPAQWAQHRVEDALVKPLAGVEGHRFARSRPPPRERRVRILQTTPTLDKSGRPFLSFAVDVRFGASEWRENDIVGCAYTGSGELYVKRGDEYRPASFLLGKDEGPVAGVCAAAPPRS
jgi:hypothetical protein